MMTSYPVGAIVLTSLFIFLGFPYELLSGRLAGAIESASGVRVHIGDLSPRLGLAGPGLVATAEVRPGQGDGERESGTEDHELWGEPGDDPLLRHRQE